MSSSNVVKIDVKLSFKRVVVTLPRENIARILRYFRSYSGSEGDSGLSLRVAFTISYSLIGSS